MKFLEHLIVGCLFFIPTISMGEDFSCANGKQGACLDYDDKVCSPGSKCVAENATCFQPNTCGYDGFICKSEYTNLSNEYNGLLRKSKSIDNENEKIVSEYGNLLEAHNRLLKIFKELEECISNASSLDKVQKCL